MSRIKMGYCCPKCGNPLDPENNNLSVFGCRVVFSVPVVERRSGLVKQTRTDNYMLCKKCFAEATDLMRNWVK